MGMGHWVGGVLLLLGGVSAHAQADPQYPVHTLRVFMNTIQIPTVVLDEGGRPVTEKSHPRFTVSLDGGKPVPVTHARVEGEDPISLAILLDASGEEDHLLRDLKWALPNMVAKGLRPHDHVSVYAMDCALVKTMDDAPAAKDTVKAALESALGSPSLHGARGRAPCEGKLALRDTLMYVARGLAQVPGRCVILAVSNGADTTSKNDWMAATRAMQHYGTAVFGLTSQGSASAAPVPRFQVPGFSLSASRSFEPAFDSMCQTSGGLVLTANETTVSERLLHVMELLRARYIVEFPRADDMAAGNHPMVIAVAGRTYFIRPAGASMPIADPKLKDDPTVLRLPAGPPPGPEEKQ